MQAFLSSGDTRQIETALAAHGYQVSDALPWLAVSLPTGSAVSLQFGDLLAVGEGGRPQLKLRLTAQINGDLKPSAGIARWTISRCYALGPQSAVDLLLGVDLQVALKNDMRVPDDLREAGASIQSAGAYRYLFDLLADLRCALREVSVSSARSGWSGPALRLEARFLADLAMGRCGMVRPCPSTLSRDYMRLALAACDGVEALVLPALRRLIRELSMHRRTALAPDMRSARPGKRLPFVPAVALATESETVQ